MNPTLCTFKKDSFDMVNKPFVERKK